jgi:hypothetical protein
MGGDGNAKLHRQQARQTNTCAQRGEVQNCNLMDGSALREWMRLVMKEMGWSARQWAEAASTSPSNITRFLSRDDAAFPTMRTLSKLALAAGRDVPLLSVTEKAMTTGLAPEKAKTPEYTAVRYWTKEWGDRKIPIDQVKLDLNVRRARRKKAPSENTLLARPSNPKMIWPGTNADTIGVYATAKGHDGRIILSYEPIAIISRPEPLRGMRGGFGFYVVDTTMVPRYELGDLVLVRQFSDPDDDDDVAVVEPRDAITHTITMGRLKGSSADRFWVTQLNPSRTIEILGKRSKALVIVGRYNRSRWPHHLALQGD